MKTHLKTILITCATMFAVYHWIAALLLSFAGAYFFISYRACIHLEDKTFAIPVFIIWPVAVFLHEEVGEGIRADLRQWLGDYEVKFQTPIIITKK